MITQFQGEDRWTAIVSHYSLDIEEEEDFKQFIEDEGFSPESEDVIIEGLYDRWIQENEREL